MHYKFRWNRIIKGIPKRGFSFKLLCRIMQKQSFAIIRQSSTKIDQASFAKFVEQCCHIYMTAVFDNIFRQYSTTFDKKFCRMLAKNVECRHLLAKNLVEKCCRASTIFFYNNFRQSSTAIYKKFVDCRWNLSNAVEIYCRKFLSKNAGEKYCRIIIRQHFSTHFYSKFLGLFVN